MIRVDSIVIKVDDDQKQAEFWSQVLQQERHIDRSDFIVLSPMHGEGPSIALDTMRSEVQLPPRIHLDLYADNQSEEVQRLIDLGATEVHWERRPTDADYVILADPEGNGFCVIDASD